MSALVEVLRRRAQNLDVTAWWVLNDNNHFGERRFRSFEPGGRPLEENERPADEATLVADLRTRASAGDARAAIILAEVGIKE